MNPQTTLKFDVKLSLIMIGNPFPDFSKSSMFLPALYIALFLVPTVNLNNVEPSLPAYNSAPYKEYIQHKLSHMYTY